MFYFAVFSSDNEKEIKDFFNVIQIFNEEIILISYDVMVKVYEVTVDIKSFGYEKYVSESMKKSYEKYNTLKKYFERCSNEEYIEDYENIYISDNNNFSKIYIYAKNLKNNEFFNLNGIKKRVLEIAPTIIERSEIRIWNQQFKQYFKTEYHKFLIYCIDRTHWEISFTNPVEFEFNKELEILNIVDYVPDEEEDSDYSEYDDEEDYYDFHDDDYYNEMEEAGIDNY